MGIAGVMWFRSGTEWRWVDVKFTIVFSWFNMLYKYSHYNQSNTIKICHLILKLKQIYSPFLLFIIVCLIEQDIRYDALFALIMGII